MYKNKKILANKIKTGEKLAGKKRSCFIDKTILVVGGAGFIGSNLISELLKNKARVICFDNLSNGCMENLKDFINDRNFVFIHGDVNLFDEIKKVFDIYNIDYVFHYAAKIGVIRTIRYPVSVLNDINGIRNIFELSHKNKVKKVIFASSSEVYGEPVEIPEKEDGHINPKLVYAVVKLVGENYVKSYYKAYGLNACALRFFNVYGPKQDSSSYGFVTGIFIKQALEGKPLTVFGDGTQTRDFIFVKDTVKMSLLALLSNKANGEVINIGKGKPVTISDLAKHIIAISKDNKLSIKFIEPRKEGGIRHRFPDISKMEKMLKCKPQYSIEDGLRRTFKWYKGNLKLQKK